MKHEEIQERAKGDLTELLNEERDPYPKVIEIHPTDRCNHRCDYCFHEGIGHDPEREHEVISVQRYAELFDELSRHGIRHLSIAGGGEPLMDPRAPTIYRMATECGLRVRTVSNGNFLSNEILDCILNTAELRISVDAATPETYGQLRNVSGELYHRTIHNLERVLEEREQRDVDLQIGTTFLINDRNKNEAVQFAEEMVDRGVDAVVFKHDIYNLVTTEQEVLNKIQQDLEGIDDDIVDVRPKLDMEVPETQCFIPYFKTAITPYGEVYSCCLGTQPGEEDGYKLGNLWEDTFEEIWQNSSKLRRDLREKGVDCRSCNHTDYKINQGMETLREK